MAEAKTTKNGTGTERKETYKRDSRGVHKNTYRRFKEGEDYDSIEAKETHALCKLVKDGFLGAVETENGVRVEQKRGGYNKKLPNVEDFVEVATRYFDYIDQSADKGVELIPDIEGFCCFAGISRDSLNDWERTRAGVYSDTIKQFKTAVAAYKKQLAYKGKVPPIVFATDFNNNHGYIQQHTLEVQSTKKLDELPTKEDIQRRLPPLNSAIDADIDEDL